MAETKNKDSYVCTYYNGKVVKAKDGGECYNYEPRNHDAYTCAGRACGLCYYAKKK